MEENGKRQYERTSFKNFEIMIEVESKKDIDNPKKLQGYFKDISVGGCKIALNTQGLNAGEVITLRFAIPDIGNVVLSGTVKGMEPDHTYYVYRVEFLKLTKERIKMLKPYFNFILK